MIQAPTYWVVLGIAFAGFWVIPLRARLGFLAAVSFAYLFRLNPIHVSVLAGWTLLFYGLAPLAGKEGVRRWIVPFLTLGILGYLGYYKYVPAVIAAFASTEVEKNLVIPLGISYFTFKLIHYAVEVGRGTIKSRSLPAFLCYVFLFPIFTAGPIERFDHFMTKRQERWDTGSIVEGVTRIIHGLIKKLIIADMFLVMFLGDLEAWRIVQDQTLGVGTLWRYMVLSYLIAYLDFSAYSDIAIGTSRLFGLQIQENFNWPILAANISEFWKRWHMSLVNWCMSYVFMPILGRWRNPYAATYTTFVAMGLWHGASLNWVLWGLYNAAGLTVFQWWSRYRRKQKWKFPDHPLWRYVAIVMTFVFVTGYWPFIVADSVGGVYDGIRLFFRLFCVQLPG